jgi:hypothetical protein
MFLHLWIYDQMPTSWILMFPTWPTDSVLHCIWCPQLTWSSLYCIQMFQTFTWSCTLLWTRGDLCTLYCDSRYWTSRASPSLTSGSMCLGTWCLSLEPKGFLYLYVLLSEALTPVLHFCNSYFISVCSHFVFCLSKASLYFSCFTWIQMALL